MYAYLSQLISCTQKKVKKEKKKNSHHNGRIVNDRSLKIYEIRELLFCVIILKKMSGAKPMYYDVYTCITLASQSHNKNVKENKIILACVGFFCIHGAQTVHIPRYTIFSFKKNVRVCAFLHGVNNPDTYCCLRVKIKTRNAVSTSSYYDLKLHCTILSIAFFIITHINGTKAIYVSYVKCWLTRTNLQLNQENMLIIDLT